VTEPIKVSDNDSSHFTESWKRNGSTTEENSGIVQTCRGATVATYATSAALSSQGWHTA